MLIESCETFRQLIFFAAAVTDEDDGDFKMLGLVSSPSILAQGLPPYSILFISSATNCTFVPTTICTEVLLGRITPDIPADFIRRSFTRA